MEAPVAKKTPSSRTLFGVTLHDDYAWMRQREAPEVRAYLEAENAYTQAQMAHTKDFQDTLYQEMLGRIKEDDTSVPYQKDNHFYYIRTVEGKPYAIHCRTLGAEGPEEILIDENELAAGKEFFDLGDLDISTNEQLMAYTTDENGSERYQLHVRNLETGDLQENIVDNIYGEIEWANDNATLYYITREDGTDRPHKLFRRSLGQEGESELVFHEADEGFFLSIGKTKDDRYLLIDLSSHVTTEVWCLDAEDPNAQPQLVIPRRPGIELGMVHNDGWWYIMTNEAALNFRLLRTRVEAPEREHWEEVLPHSPDFKIDYAESFRDRLAIFGRKNGLKSIVVYHIPTGATHDVPFPDPVYTAGASSNLEFESQVLRFKYSSLTRPASVFDYDMETGTRSLLKQTEVRGGYDASAYDSARIFATAPDGTQVPVSLVWNKARRQDRPQETLLYAYGSYGHSIDPTFSSARLSLLDRGLIFAIAHIRGGGEMGRAWYENGKFLFKKNTFSDFIAVAEHLITTGVTARDRLGIMGGSAGGLLMGAVINMRPDLFKVVEAHVPFVDVMNTMLDPSIPLTVIEYDEWGNPNEENYFHYMHSYSPYDNVQPQDYPDLLITAGLNDPRVQYWEPAKWCAKLRQCKSTDRPLLLKTNMGAGHQGASGRYGYLKEIAFDYAFLLDRLGIADEPAGHQ
ncbi:MAG: S9 family peptidase [Bacteroidota bacterium]